MVSSCSQGGLVFPTGAKKCWRVGDGLFVVKEASLVERDLGKSFFLSMEQEFGKEGVELIGRLTLEVGVREASN